MPLRKVARAALFAAFGVASVRALAAPPELPGYRIAKPPVIDGTIDAAEWEGAPVGTNFTDPFRSAPATEQTFVRLAYDAEAIYVAILAEDPRPEEIVAREITPNASFSGEDTLTFQINPFGNRSFDQISSFTVNALNTQAERIAGGRSSKREWRGDWASAVKRLPNGWSAEMRIPWRMLNVPGGAGRNMDFNVVRFQGRKQIATVYAFLTLAERPDLLAIWRGVDVPAQKTRPRVQFLSYLAPEVGDGAQGTRSGLDARYAITPQITALASLTPDFRNVENQVAGVDFVRTERFFDELRPFFREGGDFFQLTGGFGIGQMLYTPRIGEIDVGGKVFGQLNPRTGFGALVTRKQGQQSTAVARVAHQIDPLANVSAYATGYEAGGQENTSMGANGYVRRGNFFADAQLAGERGRLGPMDSAGSYSVGYQAPRWFGVLRGIWVEPDFSPSLAFIPWTDRRGGYLYTETYREFRSGPWREGSLNLYATDFRTYRGGIQERGFNPSFSVTTRRDLRFSLNHSQFAYADGYDNVWSGGVTVNATNRFRRLGVFYEAGKRGGQPATFVSLGGSYRLFGRCDIGVERSVLRRGNSDELLIVTLGAELNRRQAVTGRLVTRNGESNAYVSFRNAGLSGLEVFLILGDPNAPRTTRRASLKFVYAF